MEWKCGLLMDPCQFKTSELKCSYTLACPKRALDYKVIDWKDKINTIKYLREHFSLGLKDAKDITEIVTYCYVNRPKDQVSNDSVLVNGTLQVFGKGELLPDHEKELNSFNRTPEQKIIYALGMLGDMAGRFSELDPQEKDTMRHIYDARTIITQALQEMQK